MKIRKSYGIACFRYKNFNKKYEFLFIKKRLTYAFISFVEGAYLKNISDINILLLLNKMTVDEKITIKSLNFDIIWYKCFLEDPNINKKSFNTYNKLKTKFNNTFLQDSGKKLKYLIEKSTSINLIWELPKGHKNNKESNINAGIREFYEETGISKFKYKILFDIKPITYSFIDDNVKYIYVYYIAKLIDIHYIPSVKLNIKSVINEVSDIKFLSMVEINLLIKDNILICELKKLIKYLKFY